MKYVSDLNAWKVVVKHGFIWDIIELEIDAGTHTSVLNGFGTKLA